MRISAELIPGLLTQEVTPEAILDDYPDPEPDEFVPLLPIRTWKLPGTRCPLYRLRNREIS